MLRKFLHLAMAKQDSQQEISFEYIPRLEPLQGFGKLGLVELAEYFVLFRGTFPVFYIYAGAGALIREKSFLWLCQKMPEEVSEADRVRYYFAYVQLVYLLIDQLLYNSIAFAFPEKEAQAVFHAVKHTDLNRLCHFECFGQK